MNVLRNLLEYRTVHIDWINLSNVLIPLQGTFEIGHVILAVPLVVHLMT